MSFSNKFKFTVALAVTIINLGWALPAEAQDDERPPTRSTAPVSTPVSTDGPTVLECLPLAGEICPPAPSTGGGGGDDRRVIVDKPHACIYGELVSFTEHVRLRSEEGLPAPIRPRGYDDLRMVEDEVDMGGGSTADVGFGGVCHCPVGYELRPLASGYDANREVETQIDRRIDRQNSMQCVPRVGDTAPSTPPSVDLRPLIVWLEMHDDSICALRATALCRTAVEELNRCEATAQAARDNEAFEACFEQHHYTDSVTIQAGDAVVGGIESCVGATFECSRLEVFYAPVPALPADEVGEGSSVGEFLSQNLDLQVDVNLCAGQSGLVSSLVCGEIGGQVNLRPFASNRVGLVLRGSFGGGNIGDENLDIQDYVPVDRFTRGSVSLGLQIALVPRLRLDILAGFVRYTTGNSAENGSGDGARGNGLRTELAFTVDLTRPRSGFRAVPYFRVGVDVQHVTWDIFTTSGGHNYVNRTGVAGMIGFGLRLGSGAILAH